MRAKGIPDNSANSRRAAPLVFTSLHESYADFRRESGDKRTILGPRSGQAPVPTYALAESPMTSSKQNRFDPHPNRSTRMCRR